MERKGEGKAEKGVERGVEGEGMSLIITKTWYLLKIRFTRNLRILLLYIFIHFI